MDEKAPDLYTDSVQIQLSPFGALFVLMLVPPGQGPNTVPEKLAHVRMSLEHAKVLAIMLRKQLQKFEHDMGDKIPIHPSVAQQVGISRQEDW